MGRSRPKRRTKAPDHREVIHLLNQRYHREFLRAERLQQSWWYRVIQKLKRLFQREQRPTQIPLTMNPVTPSGRVSIVIPFRDQLGLLRDCIRSIRLSTYRNREIILVNNDSRSASMLRYLRFAQRKGVPVVDCPEDFNFSLLCNRGAEAANGDYLLFLNNDTIVLTPDWLEQLLAVALQSEVGVVGALLLYPDTTIQHAGMWKSRGGWDHIDRGKFETSRHPCAVQAVTGACLMIARELFLEVGGFDESLPIENNDTDLCERVQNQGLKVALAPEAKLIHYESLTRGYSNGEAG